MIASSVLTLAFAAFAGLGQAQPLEARANTISCSEDSTVGLLKFHQNAFHGSVDPVIVHESAHGQKQLVINNGSMKIRGRKCKSSHLGLSYDEKDGSSGSTESFPSKLFLYDDESKCLQRHAALHLSGPRRTHVTVEDCSDVDDSDQARQFFISSGNFSTATPYYKSSKQHDFAVGVVVTDDVSNIYASLDFNEPSYFKLVGL